MFRSKNTPRRAAREEPEGSQTSQPRPGRPNYPRFQGSLQAERYEEIKRWSFIRERRVDLENGEFPSVQRVIRQRGWDTLTHPNSNFDPEIVWEFYASAWPGPDAPEIIERVAVVRGVRIPYDRDAIQRYLGTGLRLQEGQRCDYARVRDEMGFEPWTVSELLCREGEQCEIGRRDLPTIILRKKMQWEAQVWTSLVLSNICPTDHNSDVSLQLPHGRAYVVYAILSGMSVDVARLISDAIYQFATIEPSPRSRTQRKAIGFPALITSLCAYHHVQVTRTERIKPPMTRTYIERNCYQGYEGRPPMDDDDEAAPPAPPAPPARHPRRPPPPLRGGHSTIDLHARAQIASVHRGLVHMNSCHYRSHQQHYPGEPNPYSTDDEFRAVLAWPGDSPVHTEEVEESEDSDSDEEMAEEDDD